MIKTSIIFRLFLLFVTIGFFSCASISKFNTAQEAFDHKHYSVAAQLLEKDIKKNRNNYRQKALLLAESYNMMSNANKAIYWYNIALDDNNGKYVRYKLVVLYKTIEKYKKALDILKSIQSKYGNSQLLQREIVVCKQAIEWKNAKKNNVSIEKMDLNSEFSEFVSDYYLKDYIIITSDRYNSKKDKYGWTGGYYYDLYLSDISGATGLIPFSKDINGKFNEASACFNEGGDLMFFVKCGGGDEEVQNCKIYSSVNIGDVWTDIKELPFEVDGVNYISPALSHDGKILYFASDDKRGRGGYDIYYSQLVNDTWSMPIAMPNYINTTGDEKFISFWKDTIYFSSDFLAGLGGLDIFKTSYNKKNSRFSAPIHLDYPINSGGDDFYLLKSSDTSGIFSSSRIGGKGKDDIYRFTIEKKNYKEKLDANKVEYKDEVVDKEIYLAVKVFEKVLLDESDPNSRVIGQKNLDEATVKVNGKLISVKNGVFVESIEFDKSYKVVVGKQGYLSGSSLIEIGAEDEYTKSINTVNIKIVLDKIFLDKEIVLKNIHYDFDKWDLREDAYPTLDELYNILRNNNKYSIIIGSHTDCQGTDEYNIVLSQKRAKSVVDYLISKGINKDRLEPKGYGESMLIEPCECNECTDEQNQKNRRTTFKLIKK